MKNKMSLKEIDDYCLDYEKFLAEKNNSAV
jgi:hypothetical protein